MYKVNQDKLEKNWEIERRPTAAVPWTDYVNSQPIKDLRSWQRSLAYYYGVYGNKIEFSKKVFKILCESKECKKYDIRTTCDLSKFLWGNYDNQAKIIFNNNLQDGLIIMSSISDFLPYYYKDLEATVF